MKTINKIFSFAMTMMLGVTVTSCTDGNDWDIDKAFDRLFGVIEDKLSVETTATTATVEFSQAQVTKDPVYFVIEVSKDSLYDEVPMGGDKSKVFGEDKSITKSPVVLTGLDGETKYYMRVKTMSENHSESRWVYYKDGESFKTKAEQIFDEVSADDYTDSQVTLRWTAPADSVTNILIAQGTDTTDYVLTDEDKANMTHTFTGLNQITTYTFIIYNGEAKRGSRTVTTTAAPPAASYTEYIGSGETRLNQARMDEIVANAKAETGETNISITIVFPAGKTVEIIGDDTQTDPGSLVIPDGVSINFFGRGGGEVPVLSILKSIDLAGSHNFVNFEHLKFVDNGANYLMNQSKACTVDQIQFKDCEATGMKNAFFRLQGSEVKVINNFVVDNCLMHDMCSGYSFIHVDAGSGAGVVKNIKITNSTLWNIATGGKMFIYSKKTNMETIDIENCTFYNNVGNNNYFVDFGDASYGPSASFKVYNCVFGKSADNATKNVRSSLDPDVVNTYCTNDFYKEKGFPGIIVLEYASDKLFENPEKADFHFQTGTVENEQVGDPRWWSVEE